MHGPGRGYGRVAIGIDDRLIESEIRTGGSLGTKSRPGNNIYDKTPGRIGPGICGKPLLAANSPPIGKLPSRSRL
jgi:hypothetical protein